MSRKKHNKQMLAMVLIALFVAVSSAQAVSPAGGGELCVTESAASRSEYVLVFSDEFNKPDGTLPDSEVWTPCTRRPKVTWARFLSNSPKVAFIQDGNLVLRAIPNPDRSTDDVYMLTGGINSSQKFAFRYGRVECRALVNPFIGNFPAIWMMPKTALAWPKGGEIDIFEQINTEQKAYSTVHSAWTKSHPDETHSGNVNLPMNRYHVYALEWEKDVLTFFADGKKVYQYKKQNDSQEQWPFDKSDFYLILNQSVGDGTWAKMPDVMHTYEMRIDWIRVYQKKKDISQVAKSAVS
ncbi:glycoside hydrolase family 16 protein [Prevotella histicola]|jgi:glucan endo-1,3-beta-glucosidase A1 domain protein|uniref:glycoside hydrolase family 16 protein n=1 Tax=Prevotella histicola TaxID=470565 RepID=UPI00241C1756|nr:glycoside hydrolase family 16 protein [Prevotella histicola]